mmetsp:Transcript_27235/g.63256  ORF Transcript_27235/g.63256 Transcript_27235/m.63256 type:complete len:81 (+) Transcript_27235:583-825(+)
MKLPPASRLDRLTQRTEDPDECCFRAMLRLTTWCQIRKEKVRQPPGQVRTHPKDARTTNDSCRRHPASASWKPTLDCQQH